jgi:hypothetical protein
MRGVMGGTIQPINPALHIEIREINMNQENQTQKTLEPSPVMGQISLLNIRINDMMSQLNTVMKALIDENQALKKENAELKQKTNPEV